MPEFDATRSGFGFERPAEGQTNDWLTPPKLVERIGPFDLDPCGCPGQPWELATRTFYPPEQDGLLLPWEGRVFCNPPYGPYVARWVERMALHHNGILLIFSRTETNAWLPVWRGGDLFLFPRGRISFFRPDGTRAKGGTAPSALIAYGPESVARLLKSGIAGAYLSGVSLRTGTKGSEF